MQLAKIRRKTQAVKKKFYEIWKIAVDLGRFGEGGVRPARSAATRAGAALRDRARQTARDGGAGAGRQDGRGMAGMCGTGAGRTHGRERNAMRGGASAAGRSRYAGAARADARRHPKTARGGEVRADRPAFAGTSSSAFPSISNRPG